MSLIAKPIVAVIAIVALLVCGSVRAQEPSQHIGLKIRTLTLELRKQHNLAEDVKGALVTAVNPGSPAQEKGIVAGDVIVEAGSKPVTAAKEVATQVAAATASGNETILFRVMNTKGERRDVTIAIRKSPANGSGPVLPGPK
jgi:S1-C subfamily serine protease